MYPPRHRGRSATDAGAWEPTGSWSSCPRAAQRRGWWCTTPTAALPRCAATACAASPSTSWTGSRAAMRWRSRPGRAHRAGGEVVEVEIELGPARLQAPHLPPGPGGGPFVAARVPGVDWPGTAVSMGNPHLVLLGAPAEVVREHGPRLEHLPGFPDRTNVEAVSRAGEGLRVSVWERSEEH